MSIWLFKIIVIGLIRLVVLYFKKNKYINVELKGGWGVWGNGLNGELRLVYKYRWFMRLL